MYILHVYALELLTWLNYFHFRHYRLLVVLSTPFVQSWHFPRNHMVHVLFKASHAYAVTWQGRFTCLLGNLLWHPPLWNAGNITKEAGPVNMNFTIPMYNASKLQVRPFMPLWNVSIRTVELGSVLVPLAKLLVHDWPSFECILKLAMCFSKLVSTWCYTLLALMWFTYSSRPSLLKNIDMHNSLWNVSDQQLWILCFLYCRSGIFR